MKKEYSKPGIIIEDFQMAQSIAIACSGVGPGGDGGTIGSATHADMENRNICILDLINYRLQ